MNRTIAALFFVATFSAHAQTVLAPPTTTALPPASGSTVTTVPGLAIPGTAATGAATTGVSNSASDLGTSLINLQFQMESALPLLAAYNDSFTFVSNGPTATTGFAPVPLGPSVTNGVSALTGTTALTATTNAGTGVGTTALTSTNGFAAFPITSDTLRALLVVQSDIERLLPVLTAVNNGFSFQGGGILPGTTPVSSSATNAFGGAASNPAMMAPPVQLPELPPRTQ